MARRKKKIQPPIFLSTGPLPSRIAGDYADYLLIFSDASLLHQGGMAAVLFETADADPIVATKSVPITGSNELELQAAIFALQQSEQLFPNRQSVLFTDNQDTEKRLNHAKVQSFAGDLALEQMFKAAEINSPLRNNTIKWIKGHGTCRGNNIADRYARIAAMKRQTSQ